MIRINLSPEPQWLDLGHGVRLKLLPLTTALMVATRSDPAVRDLTTDASNDTRAAVFAAALARRAVVDWEGVGDAEGAVIAVSCCRFRGHEDKIVTKEPEIGYDETEVQPRVQDRGCEAGYRHGCGGGAGRA
jgi:hypothetical protein